MLILAPNPSQTIKIEASSEAGFSLLEILVVLALMGIMLSVVSVRLVGTAESVYFKKRQMILWPIFFHYGQMQF